MFDVDVTGLNTIRGSLIASDRLIAAQAGRLVRETAADVTATAKVLAPVRTGNLRRSITMQVENVKGGIEAVVGTDVEYGPFIERGTSKMAPRAFLGPALDRHGWQLAEGLARLGGSILE